MNDDGIVNISDVTIMIDYLLGIPGMIYTAGADMNENGDVNISDLTSLIDYLLN